MSTAMRTGTGLRTDAEIRALICPPEAAFVEAAIGDPRLPGFTIRAYASGRKVFFLLYRFHRQRKRLKIGLYSPPSFGLAAARLAASAKLASVTLGADPARTRGEARRAANVRELYEQFEREVVKRFPAKTRANWRCTSNRFLREISSLPITATDEICDRVMTLHKRIGFTEEKEALAHTLFKHACRFFRWAVNERKLKSTQYPPWPASVRASGTRSGRATTILRRSADSSWPFAMFGPGGRRMWPPKRAPRRIAAGRPFTAATFCSSGTSAAAAAP